MAATPLPRAYIPTVMPTTTRVVIKACGCCGASYDADEWLKLPLVGEMRTLTPGKYLELRNCKCGGTYAVERQREPTVRPPLTPMQRLSLDEMAQSIAWRARGGQRQ